MSDLTPKLLAFSAGLISAAFGAGITFSAWQASHPSDVEIAQALGCAAYGGRLGDCSIARDAKEARRETLALINDLRELRRNTTLGFGRAMAAKPTPAARDAAGKAALRMYQQELRDGVPPDEAMLHVIEADLRP